MYASGASSFHLWIVEEFNNLKKAKPDATVDFVVSNNTLLLAFIVYSINIIVEVLDDVLKIKPPREYPLETAHLGTLFIMDKDKDGKFSLHDLIDFATLYHERQARQDVVDFLVINSKFVENLFYSLIMPPICVMLFVHSVFHSLQRLNYSVADRLFISPNRKTFKASVPCSCGTTCRNRMASKHLSSGSASYSRTI